MGNIWQDIRFAARTLWKNRGFTAVAVMAVALGVGTNTMIFSCVNALLLRPFAYTTTERAVMVWEKGIEGSFQRGSVAPANYFDWRDQTKVFQELAAYNQQHFSLNEGDQPERVPGARVTPNLFRVLAVGAERGRTFSEEEGQDGRGQVAIIKHSLWQRRFASDPDVVGKTIRVDSKPYTIVGVMPQEFDFPLNASEIWLPRTFNPEERKTRDNHYLQVVGLLKPGASAEGANAEVRAVAERAQHLYPDSNGGRTAFVETITSTFTRGPRPYLIIMMGAVGFVLLIACANVANLLLARAAGRQKEIAVRIALGATRLRLVRQLLVESVLLALIGGAAGLMLGWWGIDLLKGLLPPDFPRVADIAVDMRVLGFTLLVSFATGVLFGLAPALQFTNPDVHAALKESARGSTGGSRQSRLRGLLIVSEVALSLVLLVGAGLLFRSFLQLQSVELGFRPQRVLTFRLTPSGADFREDAQFSNFYKRVAERVGAIPGVEAVGIINTLPLVKGPTSGFQVEGRPPTTRDQWASVNYRSISPDYFRAVNVPLLRGRALDERDNESSPLALVVNQSLARRDFSGEDPVGKRISFGTRRDGTSIWFEVVGVVSDVRSMELGTEPTPEVYTSYLQDPFAGMSFVVRSATEPEGLVPSVREAAREIDRAQPVSDVRTLEQLVSDAASEPRFNSLLLGVFAGLALLLAAAGIYGVMSYSVTQRTHEIGIRIALGAQSRDVLRFVVGQGMTLALVGVAIGLIVALAITRLMSSFLYGVTATDPATFVGVSLLLALIALLACYVPARRATKVDPIVALRYE